jgi:type IV pilus assembly protein PilW
MSLVELMVGIAVGLLVVVAASGSLSFFEGQRNTSLSGNAAMNSGVMAGYLLQRDLRNAGVGLMNATQIACNTLNVFYSGATKANGLPVAPVLITDGGAGSDSISIFFAASVLGSAPVQLTRGLTAATDNLHVNSTSGLQQGDVVLIAGASGADPCSVAQLSAVTPTGTDVELAHTSGGSYPFNPADPAGAFTTAPLYAAGGAVLRTGSGITWRSYSVDNTNALVAADRITGNTIKVATNVLSMQAQYGITDGISNEIRQWVDATNEWDSTLGPLDAPHIARIRAVRFSVIVRSAKKELARDASGVCTTTTAAPQPWPDAPAMDLSANPDWGCYRYQVYASIAPLKNVVWSVSQ